MQILNPATPYRWLERSWMRERLGLDATPGPSDVHNGGFITCLAVLPDGRLASGHSAGGIRLWDLETGTCVALIQGHQGSISALAVLPQGLASIAIPETGRNGHTIRLWNPAQPDGEPRILFVADAPLTALAAILGNPRLVAGEATGRLHWLQMPPSD